MLVLNDPPVRGMNFGPLIYNTTSNPRMFEISNVGEFPFDVNLINYVGVWQTLLAIPATSSTRLLSPRLLR